MPLEFLDCRHSSHNLDLSPLVYTRLREVLCGVGVYTNNTHNLQRCRRLQIINAKTLIPWRGSGG